MIKYVLVKDDVTMSDDDRILYRIQAVRDFGDVVEGELGGFVEKEENLSHEGNCWIYDDAMVYANAQVYGDACIYDSVLAECDVKIYGNAKITDQVILSGRSRVYGNAQISDDALINYDSQVYDNAKVSGNTILEGNAQVYDNASVSGDVELRGNTKIHGTAVLSGCTFVEDYSEVCGNARVFDAVIRGHAKIYGNANIGQDGYNCDIDISGNVEIYDNARIFDFVTISGDVKVYGNAIINDDAQISGNVEVYGDACVHSANLSENCKVCGDAVIGSYAIIKGTACVTHGCIQDGAEVLNNRHFVVMDNDNGAGEIIPFTFYRNKYNGISVYGGDDADTLEDFIVLEKECYAEDGDFPNKERYEIGKKMVLDALSYIALDVDKIKTVMEELHYGKEVYHDK